MHGTVQLKTNRLLLRKYKMEDAETLFRDFGQKAEMSEYSGWNPYETLDMTKQTIQNFINSYSDPSSYSWVIEYNGMPAGTIGAYDYNKKENSIELGISIAMNHWGHGFASEAASAVIKYLAFDEGSRELRAWCASDNTGSKKVMEKCGMVLDSTDENALKIGDNVFDKLNFVFRSAD